MQVRCPWEPGSESRPGCFHWGRRGKRSACTPLRPRPPTPAGLPSSRSAAAHTSRRINKLPLGRQGRPVPCPLWFLCCSFPFLPMGALFPCFSWGLAGVGAAPGARSGSCLGLGRARHSICDKGFRPQCRSPPTPNYSPGAKPSGRDLSGGWKGTAPGKEEGAIPGRTRPPRCHFSFPRAVTADKWD